MIFPEKDMTSDSSGLHPRAGAQLISLVVEYKNRVLLQKNFLIADARSVPSIAQLAAAFGPDLDFIVEEDSASSVMEYIKDYFTDKTWFN